MITLHVLPFFYFMAKSLISIDGSLGEGGGQILRTSLALSAITQKPFEIYNIRSNRKNPGLGHQHLQAVNAASEICDAIVTGNKLRSTALKFYPNKIQPGNYRLDIGTAGSVCLVLQTIFYPLCFAERPSTVTIIGGTHVEHSPCIHYLVQQWLYYLKQIGYSAKTELLRAGYFPRGGGKIEAKINPSATHLSIRIKERGRLLHVKGISAVSNLDSNIAIRQKSQAEKRLLKQEIPHTIVQEEIPAIGKGTFFLLLGEFEHSQCCYFGLGAIGKRAEKVADEACNKFFDFLKTEGVFDEYLSDQLIIPLALSEAQSCFVTPIITQHLLTNIDIVKLFLRAKIHVQGKINTPGVIQIK